jgi:hypothetical protein
VLEFAVRTGQGEVNFEVKSPRLQRAGRLGREEEESAGAFDNYSAALAMNGALRSANRQFVRAQRNVLVIALPEVGDKSAGMLSEKWPGPIIRALYGVEQLTAPPSGRPGSSSLANGNFLKRLNGTLRFTRISAVVELEDSFPDPALQAVVLHNPHSEKPLDRSMFGSWRQFAAIDGEIRCFPPSDPTRTGEPSARHCR